MIYLDPIANIVGQILSWIIFFYVFEKVYRPNLLSLTIIFIITVLGSLFFTDFAYLIVVITAYLILNPHKKRNLFLINSLLISILLRLLSETLAKTTVVLFNINHISTHSLSGSCIFVAITILIETSIALAFVYLYKRFNLTSAWQLENSSLFSILITYLFLVIFIFMRIIQHYQAYSDLLSGILLFILIQCTFIVIVFLKSSQIQKESYTRELGKEQLKNLKMYTDQLEHDQLKLRNFEHNYKNQIKDLRSIAVNGDFEKMKVSLVELEDYSNSYFDNISMQLFKDLNNVQNPYLKSLLISKLTLIHQNKTTCHFECRNIVNDVTINIFDLVRLLGISIDNAIEETKGQKNSEIQLAIIQESKQLSFLIINTTHTKTKINQMMQDGYSTKKNHAGFGLANVQDIKKKYPNLFVQYRNDNSWFKLNIQIIK